MLFEIHGCHSWLGIADNDETFLTVSMAKPKIPTFTRINPTEKHMDLDFAAAFKNSVQYRDQYSPALAFGD
jgi:hypothetical protein